MNFSAATYLSVFFKIKWKQVADLLPFLKGKSYTTFLIVGHPRTGTSLLHTYLNSHVHIHSLNEPLAHTSKADSLFKPYSKMIQAVGFKYFFEYIADDTKKMVLLEMLKSRAMKVVVIRRKNYLRTYVSLCIAQKTDEWSSTGYSQNRLLDKQLTLSKESCLNAFQIYKKNELETIAIFKQLSIPMFEIEYETLVESPKETLPALQHFLGVKPQPLQTLLVRQNNEELSSLVLNYQTLKNAFANSEYEHFFDE